MSEYQYFEFQAIDRTLTRAQMDELRRCSSRAEITPTSFVNEYHYGDFRGSPERWMAAYFDAFVDVANWGTRWLMLRLPAALFPAERLAPFVTLDEALTVRKEEGSTILSFYNNQEDPDWVEGEGWLATLIPLRTALLDEDDRCLYLGWLLGAQTGEVEEEALEPPVPPGLGTLDEALKGLVRFLGIDEDLVAVAAERSPIAESVLPSPEALARWVAALPAADKDALLLALLAGEGHPAVPTALLGLRQRARRELADRSPPPATAMLPGRRSAGALIENAQARAETRRRAEAERQARARAEQAAELAKRRELRLLGLRGKEAELWQQVEALIATRQPKSYDRAIEILVDLRDLAARSGEGGALAPRLRALAEQHQKKPAWVRRLQASGLLAGG